MTAFILCFAVFGAIGIFVMLGLDRIRVILSSRHPEKFSEMQEVYNYDRAFSKAPIISKYIWSGRIKAIADRDLRRTVIFTKTCQIAIIPVSVVYLALIFRSANE